MLNESVPLVRGEIKKMVEREGINVHNFLIKLFLKKSFFHLYNETKQIISCSTSKASLNKKM